MPRGRKPIPTKLKMLRGNPGKRPLSKDEPSPPALPEGTPPPTWLSARAKEHWRETVAALVALGLFTEIGFL